MAGSGGRAAVAVPSANDAAAADAEHHDTSLECSYTTSAVKVEITDLNDLTTSFNMTTCALRKCKRQVLRPYWRLLALVAWRGLGKESVHSGRWRLLNVAYTALVFLLILYGHVYNVTTCEWKLDVKTDIKAVSLAPARLIAATTTTTTTAAVLATSMPAHGGLLLPQLNASSGNLGSAGLGGSGPVTVEGAGDGSTASECEHVFSVYIVPSVIHLVAFLMGFYYFRYQESEQLYALMEKVFLDASSTQGRSTSQRKLIKKLRILLGLGALWVAMTVLTHVLFVLAFGIERRHLLSKHIGFGATMPPGFVLWLLLAIQLISVVLVNSVNVAVIVNYATQCEILIFYMRSIGIRVKERSVDLKTAMKDVLSIRESLGTLNGAMARMTSLALVRLFELFVMGSIILLLNEDTRWLVVLYRVVFVVVWGSLALLPLVQAAMLNSACNGFRKVALHTRVFGHGSSSASELDSFLLFMSNTTLRAKLFHVPVRPGYFVPLILIVAVVLLVLLQVDLIHIPKL